MQRQQVEDVQGTTAAKDEEGQTRSEEDEEYNTSIH
jgi:hypothetical protein